MSIGYVGFDERLDGFIGFVIEADGSEVAVRSGRGNFHGVCSRHGPLQHFPGTSLIHLAAVGHGRPVRGAAGFEHAVTGNGDLAVFVNYRPLGFYPCTICSGQVSQAVFLEVPLPVVPIPRPKIGGVNAVAALGPVCLIHGNHGGYVRYAPAQDIRK